MPGRPQEEGWTPEKDERLMRLRAELGPKWLDIAEAIGGHSTEACRFRYNTLKRDGLVPKVVPLHNPKDDEPADALWERVKQRTRRDVERHKKLRFVDAHLPDTGVVAITVVSDQHIRETGPVDIERMEEDALLIRDTPGCYGILGGDGVDNHIKHLTAMRHGGTNPKEEWKMYDHYLSFFGDKLLAVISGNHDDWTTDQAGVGVIERLAKDRKLFFAPDEVVVRLVVGQETYKVKVRHQYRFNSEFNKTHTVKRLWEMGLDDFDVGVVCHHHEAALEPFVKHGRVVWGARPGSYQITSAYSRQKGYNQTFPTCPTFLFWPDSHYVLGFLDLRDALRHLTACRAA